MEDQDKPAQPADQNPSPMDSGSMPPTTPPPMVEMPNTPIPTYAPPATETNTLAIVSLIASISGWVILFGIGGVIGVICGIIARNQIKESMGRQSGSGLATAGLIVGAINIGFVCILALCGVIIFGTAMVQSTR